MLRITIYGRKLEWGNRQCYQFGKTVVDLQEPENQGVIPSHLAVWDTESSKQAASKMLMWIRLRVMSTTAWSARVNITSPPLRCLEHHLTHVYTLEHKHSVVSLVNRSLSVEICSSIKRRYYCVTKRSTFLMSTTKNILKKQCLSANKVTYLNLFPSTFNANLDNCLFIPIKERELHFPMTFQTVLTPHSVFNKRLLSINSPSTQQWGLYTINVVQTHSEL
jgi:hypothetical protein